MGKFRALVRLLSCTLNSTASVPTLLSFEHSRTVKWSWSPSTASLRPPQTQRWKPREFCKADEEGEGTKRYQFFCILMWQYPCIARPLPHIALHSNSNVDRLSSTLSFAFAPRLGDSGSMIVNAERSSDTSIGRNFEASE